MACGTGKTLIAGWVREAMKAGCALFMAPSNALLAQTLQEWRQNSATPFEALAVCSDVSVADGDDADDLPAANVGAAVTTDYRDIAKFISSTGTRVVLCTYQSSEALAQAMSLVSVPEFDLAIADEAHRTAGGSDHVFPSIVHPEKIRAAKRLFMTATPRFYFDSKENDVVSMDNEELYGPVFHELDFAEAIKLGLLTAYEVLVVGVSPEAEKEAVQLIKKNPRPRGEHRDSAHDQRS
jgi:predicted helicase